MLNFFSNTKEENLLYLKFSIFDNNNPKSILISFYKCLKSVMVNPTSWNDEKVA